MEGRNDHGQDANVASYFINPAYRIEDGTETGTGGEERRLSRDACDILYGNRGHGLFWQFRGVEKSLLTGEANDAAGVLVLSQVWFLK